MNESDGRRPYLSLIIPAYNEQQRIGSSLDTICAYLDTLDFTWEIIVVDDGSSDATVDIANAHSCPNLRIISYKPNRGKGNAIRQGVFAAQGDLLAFSDADLSAPIDELPKLLKAIEAGCDVAIGSRARKGAALMKHQPLYRELGGKGLNLFIQLLATPGINDTQCGFKLFKGDAAREVFAISFINGWAFDVEALYLARKLRYKIKEIPIRWSHAEGSKISPVSAGIAVLIDLFKIRMHRYGVW